MRGRLGTAFVEDVESAADPLKAEQVSLCFDRDEPASELWAEVELVAEVLGPHADIRGERYAIYVTIPRLSARSGNATGVLIPRSRNDSGRRFGHPRCW